MYAFDLGFAIDLDRAEQTLRERAQHSRGAPPDGEHREQLRLTRRSPPSFQFAPAPLRVTTTGAAASLGHLSWAPTADVVLYDFGAASITYTSPLHSGCSAGDLIEAGTALYGSRALVDDARERLRGLLGELGGAVNRPKLDDLYEDYAVFEINEWESAGRGGEELVALLAQTIAGIVRGEPGPLSTQEVREAVSACVSYGAGDAAVIDWNAAVLFDPEPRDTLAALEFANVEMLEMRHLDDRLDRALAEAYETLDRIGGHGFGGFFGRRRMAAMERVSRLQVESAMLFEGVNNAIKLLGDQYLARVYRHATQRFHLPEWDHSILRKLATLDGIYQKLSDRQETRRMETLEWIVIALIAFEVVMAFVRE